MKSDTTNKSTRDKNLAIQESSKIITKRRKKPNINNQLIIKRKRKQWSNKQMKSAVESVTNKNTTLTFASLKYSIPLSTLRNYVLSEKQTTTTTTTKTCTGEEEQSSHENDEDDEMNESEETQTESEQDDNDNQQKEIAADLATGDAGAANKNDDKELIQIDDEDDVEDEEDNGDDDEEDVPEDEDVEDRYEEEQDEEDEEGVDLYPNIDTKSTMSNKRRQIDDEFNQNKTKKRNQEFIDQSSSDDDVREIFIDSPRTVMAKKSTSPIKFFLNNYFKNSMNNNNHSHNHTNHNSSNNNESIPGDIMRVVNQPSSANTNSTTSNTNGPLSINNPAPTTTTTTTNKSTRLQSKLKNNSSNVNTTTTATTPTLNENVSSNQSINPSSNSLSYPNNSSLGSYSTSSSSFVPSTISIIDLIINNIKPNQSNDSVYNTFQQKHKLIQEFEKSIKIYAYIALRQRYHPIFLNRTLSYMSTNKKVNPSIDVTNIVVPTESSDSRTNTIKKKKRSNFNLNEYLLKRLKENDSISSKILNGRESMDNSNKHSPSLTIKNFELKLKFDWFQLNDRLLNDFDYTSDDEYDSKNESTHNNNSNSNNQSQTESNNNSTQTYERKQLKSKNRETKLPNLTANIELYSIEQMSVQNQSPTKLKSKPIGNSSGSTNTLSACLIGKCKCSIKSKINKKANQLNDDRTTLRQSIIPNELKFNINKNTSTFYLIRLYIKKSIRNQNLKPPDQQTPTPKPMPTATSTTSGNTRSNRTKQTSSSSRQKRSKRTNSNKSNDDSKQFSKFNKSNLNLKPKKAVVQTSMIEEFFTILSFKNKKDPLTLNENQFLRNNLIELLNKNFDNSNLIDLSLDNNNNNNSSTYTFEMCQTVSAKCRLSLLEKLKIYILSSDDEVENVKDYDTDNELTQIPTNDLLIENNNKQQQTIQPTTTTNEIKNETNMKKSLTFSNKLKNELETTNSSETIADDSSGLNTKRLRRCKSSNLNVNKIESADKSNEIKLKENVKCLTSSERKIEELINKFYANDKKSLIKVSIELNQSVVTIAAAPPPPASPPFESNSNQIELRKRSPRIKPQPIITTMSFNASLSKNIKIEEIDDDVIELSPPPKKDNNFEFSSSSSSHAMIGLSNRSNQYRPNLNTSVNKYLNNRMKSPGYEYFPSPTPPSPLTLPQPTTPPQSLPQPPSLLPSIVSTNSFSSFPKPDLTDKRITRSTSVGNGVPLKQTTSLSSLTFYNSNKQVKNSNESASASSTITMTLPKSIDDNFRNKNTSFQVFYQFCSLNRPKETTNGGGGGGGAHSKNGKNTQNANKFLTQLTQFSYKNSNYEFICPFCYLNCFQINFLVSHFQMCHFRFHIEFNNTSGHSHSASCNSLNSLTYTDHQTDKLNGSASSSSSFSVMQHNGHSNSNSALNGKSIAKKIQFNVRCEEIYDGSFLGNPYDALMAAHLGYSKCRIEPSKRSSVTYILVNKKSNFIDLNQFTDLTHSELSALHFIQQQQQQLNYLMQPNDLYNCQAGIERLYFHTTTGLPIHVNEIFNDSDDELDPEWIKEQTTLLINEFADVNEGEKGIMRLWNLHCLHHNFIADSQVYQACELFIDEQTKCLIQLNLFNNFLLHLANLFDYGLLKPQQILKLVDYLHEKKAQLTTTTTTTTKQISNKKQTPSVSAQQTINSPYTNPTSMSNINSINQSKNFSFFKNFQKNFY